MPNLHRFHRGTGTTRGASAPGSRSRRARPRLEGLEGRIAPAHNITIALGGLATIPAGATTFGDTGDYTIDPGALGAVAAGTLTLRANNDITIHNNIHMADGVGLSLLAGRNLTLITEINYFLAPLVLTANAASGLGVNQANRDPGDAALILSDARLNASTSNTATLTGDVGDRDGANLHPNAPVLFLGTTQFLNSGAVVTGRGNASEPAGIFVSEDAVIAASGGLDVVLNGTAFNGDRTFNPAVDIRGRVTSVNGDITINGRGAGAGPSSYGINVQGPAGKVRATGAGSIALTGTGGTGSGSFGIELAGISPDPVALVEAAAGTITLNGTGGGPAFHFGVSIEQNALVRATGDADVVLNGNAGGISFDPFGSGSGFVSLESGDLSLVGDALDPGAPGSLAAAGPASRLLIQTATAARPLVLGGDAGGALVFDAATAAAIVGFGLVTLNAGAGDITTGGDLGPLGFDLVVRNLSNTTGGIVVGHTLDSGAHLLTLETSAAIHRAAGGLLKANELLLLTIAGAGTAGTPLATQAANLAASASSGGIFLANAGDVTIGAGSLAALRTAASGDIVLNATGRVTVDAFRQIATGGGDIDVTGVGTGGLPGVQVRGGLVDAGGGNVRLTGSGSTLGVRVTGGGKVRTSGAGAIDLIANGDAGVQVNSSGTALSTEGGPLAVVAGGPVAIGSGAALTVGGNTIFLSGNPTTVGDATLDAGAGGLISFAGATTLGPGTRLAVTLAPSLINGRRLILARGSLDLGGATLVATGPGGIPPGSRFLLVDSDGPVAGRFAQGASLTAAGDLYQVNLAGGDGNDVVLTRPGPPAGPAPTSPRPVAVRLVARRVGKGRGKAKVLFVVASFVDDGRLKAELRSPFQAPRFKQVRFTTADTDRDGVIDRVTLIANRGAKARTATVSV